VLEEFGANVRTIAGDWNARFRQATDFIRARH
jgi:hypothetical protein